MLKLTLSNWLICLLAINKGHIQSCVHAKSLLHYCYLWVVQITVCKNCNYLNASQIRFHCFSIINNKFVHRSFVEECHESTFLEVGGISTGSIAMLVSICVTLCLCVCHSLPYTHVQFNLGLYDKISITIVTKLIQGNITRLSPMALLLVLRTRNNTIGAKLVIFSCITLYYGNTYIVWSTAPILTRHCMYSGV